jgi:hypothetical protein
MSRDHSSSLPRRRRDSVQKAELVLIGSIDGAGGETVELKCMSKPRAVRMTTSTAGALKLSALTEVGNAGEMGPGSLSTETPVSPGLRSARRRSTAI